MEKFIHCIDLSDQLKNFNFCSRRALESLLSAQLLLDDSKPNPMYMDINNLINCRSEDIDGMSSPKMTVM